MRRLTACLFCLSLLTLAGCSRTAAEEREPFTQDRWKEMLRDNELRLKSEDERNKPTFAFLGKTTDAIGDQFTRIWNYITGNTPYNAAKNLLDPAFPDRRREAVVYLADRDFGRRDPYVKYYLEMAKTDDDYSVRAMAIRALNRARAREASAIYIQALENTNELVRIEAAKALANMPDPLSIGPLVNHLRNADEHVDVRVGCADALRSFRTSESAQALIGVLLDRNFGVAWQARRSLNFMTGQDFRYDPVAWLTYLSGSAKPFG